MPTCHLLVYPHGAEPNIGRYLARIKQPFSKEIKEVLIVANSILVNSLTVLERPGKTCFRFWQEGPGYDRNIFTKDAILASLDYIHTNHLNSRIVRKQPIGNGHPLRIFSLET